MDIELPSSVAARLARLAPDQRAAATAPPGPVLCVAPAGSGKTTTLVARVAWLVATGADAGSVTAITFNARAAEELRERLDPALEPLGAAPGSVRVRTFHALGLEILRSRAAPLPRLVARAPVLRAAVPDADDAQLRWLDTRISRLKLDLRATAADVTRDPAPGPLARSFLAYERALQAAGAMDFDDLVAVALRALGDDEALLAAWRRRCAHLLVDEVQDVDASQLALALVLAAPGNRIFLVGDDDQSIYGWRLADVRRVLDLAGALPGLRRVDLEVNYRCPRPVVERAVQLVAHNRERFVKIVRAGPRATGRLVLAPVATAGDPAAEAAVVGRLLQSWPSDGGSRAILARTRRELLPAAAHALEAGIPFRADRVRLLLEEPLLDRMLAAAAATPPELPVLRRLGALTARVGDIAAGAAAAGAAPAGAAPDGEPALEDDEPTEPGELLAALLAWATRHPTLEALAHAIQDARARLAALRAAPPELTLATAHATKGLEFDHVAVIGMSEGRFPSPRALADAAEPERALEEERRLAYVAWTRARRSLTLVHEPEAASRFLGEAFEPAAANGQLAPSPATRPP